MDHKNMMHTKTKGWDFTTRSGFIVAIKQAIIDSIVWSLPTSPHCTLTVKNRQVCR